MLFVKDITLGDLLRPTRHLLSDWPVANYQASNSSKICQKNCLSVHGTARSTVINSFDKTKFLFHSPTDEAPQFL